MSVKNVWILAAAAGVCLLAPRNARATFHFMQIEQVIGGVNGNTAAQAIQLRMRLAGQTLVQQARIRAWNAAGMNPVLLVDLNAPVPNGAAGSRVLIASASFASATTPAAVPNFTMTSLIPASYLPAGSITFESDTGIIFWRLSWGGAAYTGPTTGDFTNDPNGNFGPPFPGPLPSTCARALLFQGTFSAASNNNAADYALTSGPATFRNNANTAFTVNTSPGACCVAADCSDGVACTDDTCSAGSCASTPNDANCPDNGLFCDGAESCDAVLNCVSSGDPCSAGEICNEKLDVCEPGALTIVLEPVAGAGGPGPVGTTLTAPVDLTHAGDGSGRLFIADQIGLIRIVDAAGNLLTTPFLDIRAKLPVLGTIFDERGVLGLAFHPDYENNGRFFVRYSAPRVGAPEEPCNQPGFIEGCHKEVLAEYAVSADDPDVADANSEIILFEADKPQFNHNAGDLNFGPDGMLYFSLGDGGGANDGLADIPPSHGPTGNGQNPQTALGSLLRIDVDSPPDPGLPYAIPADNPFADGVDGLPEIYAYGLRNPYRFSFDDGPGGDLTLYLADVGQDLFEEINVVVNGGNYGWVIREGFHCFDPFNPSVPPPACSSVGPFGEPLIDPLNEYLHPLPCTMDSQCALFGVNCDLSTGLCDNEGGIAVVGGFVYRGSQFPDLTGKYVYGDFASSFGLPSGRLYYFDTQGPEAFQRVQFRLAPNDDPLGLYLKGFGEDENGELYVLASQALAPSGDTGVVFRIKAPCEGVADCADLDTDGIRDDNCVWSSCDGGLCSGTDIVFADLGGAFGACPPDGFANLFDRNHALTCFASTNPCDDLNIDAGGPFGSCAPDGFCNLFDATHALTAFAGTNSCTCPANPSPEAAVPTAGVATLFAAPQRTTLRPGGLVSVRVLIEEPLQNLQGYQLHLAANRAGRARGQLELVDIAVEKQRNAAFDREAPGYQAFNRATGQMFNALDDRGVATPAGAYLATFTYRASRDASGAFVIEVLHDQASGDQTFLVANYVERVEVLRSRPAVVTVDAP